MNAVLFGIGVGFGVAFWRQVPPLEPRPAPQAALVLVLLLLALAYFAGRSRGRGRDGATATAVATAGAVASAAGGSVTVNLALDQLSTAAWRGGVVPLAVQSEAAAVELVADGWTDDEVAALDPAQLVDEWQNGTSARVPDDV